jgi:hypothetical protein
MNNAAQRLIASLYGMAQDDIESTPKLAHGNKNASSTKSGAGRYHASGHERSSPPLARGRVRGDGRTRAYRALMKAWAQKRIPKWKGARDEHGAYTVVGLTGRKWLGGISAQRGY